MKLTDYMIEKLETVPASAVIIVMVIAVFAMNWILDKREDIKAIFNKFYEKRRMDEKYRQMIEEDHNKVVEYEQNRLRDREQSKNIQKELLDSQKALADTQRQLADAITELTKNDTQRNLQIETLISASKETLADRMNQKYKYYLSINGIPADEIDEFANMFSAYKAVKGNHTIDAKYNYVMNNLPVIPVEVNLVFDHKEKQAVANTTKDAN